MSLDCVHFSVYTAGDVLSWTNGTWNDLIAKTEVCSLEQQMLDVYMPWYMGMQEGQYFCDKYWGSMTVIRDLKMWEDLLATYASPYISYGTIWTGFSEDPKGQFVDIVSGTQVLQEPIESSYRGSCLALSQSGDQSRYSTNPCEWRLRFCCRVPKIARFQMRGDWFNFIFSCNDISNC